MSDATRDAPVHWLVNEDGDPTRVKTACGRFHWQWSPLYKGRKLLDLNRPILNPVTCLECLDYLAKMSAPIIVLPERPPASPYCDHTRGSIENTGGSGGPNGATYGFRCTHCNRAYEYDATASKWWELDADGRRIK